MTPPANQDDYYAQVKAAGTSGTDDKKPLKLKLKAVVKKSTEEDIPKKEEDISPREEIQDERPKARLVEREHASGGLLRSVMKSGSDDSGKRTDERREKSSGFPKISFAKAEHKVKILENRPVMQIPDEVPKRRTDGSAPVSTGPKRLRDDSKPMFQRNIGFATPQKDGTAKKSGKGK